MSEWMSRVALEMVGQTILGYSFDPLDSPYNNPYTSAVKELMCVTSSKDMSAFLHLLREGDSLQSHHLLLISRTAVRPISV